MAAEPGVGTTVDGEVQGATKDEVPLGKNEVPLAKARLVRAPSPPPRSGLLPSWMEGSVVSEPHSKSKSMVSVASETEARSRKLALQRQELSRRTEQALRRRKLAEDVKSKIEERRRYTNYEFGLQERERSKMEELEEYRQVEQASPSRRPATAAR